MLSETLSEELYAELCELPVIDIHSHLDPPAGPKPLRRGEGPRQLPSSGAGQVTSGSAGARLSAGQVTSGSAGARLSAGKVLGYHMVLYPLRAAGADETKLWFRDEPQERFDAGEFLKAWPSALHTSFGWALRTILRELFDFDEPLTAGNLPRLMESMNAASARQGRAEEILRQGNVVRILTSRPPSFAEATEGMARRSLPAFAAEAARDAAQGLCPRGSAESAGEGGPPAASGAGVVFHHADVFRYTVEVGEGATAKDHLSWPERMRMLFEGSGAAPGSQAELEEACEALLDREDWTGRLAYVRWLTGQAEFTPVPDGRLGSMMRRASSGETMTSEETCLLNAAAIRAMLRAASKRTNTFQLCFGAQRCVPGPGHPIQSLAPKFASSLGYLFAEFPDAHFNILNGYEPAEPILSSHCLAYGNVSLGGFWWHMFYPAAMHAAWHRRLDMVPPTRLCGFFSDGYCLEWQFGRLRMTQRVLANVLAERIERGFLRRGRATDVARAIFEGTPREIFLPEE